MQIDWFTIAAQVVNFLILVWLLKRFLYRPILNAIGERERTINERMQSASDREAEAAAAQQSYADQQAELAHLKDALLADAAADVEQWRRERLSELRESTLPWNHRLSWDRQSN